MWARLPRPRNGTSSFFCQRLGDIEVRGEEGNPHALAVTSMANILLKGLGVDDDSLLS